MPMSWDAKADAKAGKTLTWSAADDGHDPRVRHQNHLTQVRALGSYNGQILCCSPRAIRHRVAKMRGGGSKVNAKAGPGQQDGREMVNPAEAKGEDRNRKGTHDGAR
ncbi:hypothetical protein M433DRAFT_412365 [Acidomyces richmondensis BFW]|nr:hypothetical protein M433DRAFT_412365 [Acidomyces richmondensis BFW]